jgi:hypothetical protein
MVELTKVPSNRFLLADVYVFLCQIDIMKIAPNILQSEFTTRHELIEPPEDLDLIDFEPPVVTILVSS